MNTNDLENLLEPEDDFSEELKKLQDMLGDMGIDMNELENRYDNYTTKKEITYTTISDLSTEPSYNYPTDSGFDLHSTIDTVIPALGRTIIPTGLKFDIPDGLEIQIRPKSGLAINQGLTVLNTPGTVDSGYNGEIKVILFNTTSQEIQILRGMKVAQAVFCPVLSGKWVELKKSESVSDKDRGENGFGSTGI
jgi:dUTP pyrophosphatase